MYACYYDIVVIQNFANIATDKVLRIEKYWCKIIVRDQNYTFFNIII